jgi:hypothetical protein
MSRADHTLMNISIFESRREEMSPEVSRRSEEEEESETESAKEEESCKIEVGTGRSR